MIGSDESQQHGAIVTIGAGTMQWRCSVCNSQSPVGTGGICVRCRKFACSRHLSTVLDEGKKIRVCSSCLTSEDKVQKGLKGLLGRWFS